MTAELTNIHYDRLAPYYDRRWSRYLSRTLGFLKSRLTLLPGMTILDVGCGTGQFELLLLQERPEQQIVGVDVSVEMLKMAAAKCRDFSKVLFRQADAAALPFADHAFDLVVSASALHHFSEPEASLAEMRRVAKSTGSVVILDWCRDYFSCRLFDLFLRFMETGYAKCYTLRELRYFLEKTGCRIQVAQRVRFGLIWGMMIVEAKRDD